MATLTELVVTPGPCTHIIRVINAHSGHPVGHQLEERLDDGEGLSANRGKYTHTQISVDKGKGTWPTEQNIDTQKVWRMEPGEALAWPGANMRSASLRRPKEHISPGRKL